MFIASHRLDRAPGQRFRFEQYFEFLRQNGFQCDLSFLLNEEDDSIFYSRGHFLLKAGILLRHYKQRLADLKRANEYDIIFIFREALMTRSNYFEKKFAQSKAKVIYDFDDAIWMNSTSDANRLFKWMKNPAKIETTIAMSNLVFAGNTYLADYAKQFNKNVVVVPTTIDTHEYRRSQKVRNENRIVIGWSGSLTTIQHFEFAVPFLKTIKAKYGDRIIIKVIGDKRYRHAELGIEGIGWSRADEVKELSEIDIGIMPLPDDEWARGKCGLKGLQYMALGIPTIMSPVGVNAEIITDGENGFLASDHHAWVEKLTMLIENPKLAAEIGTKAADTVRSRYSVEANKNLYLKYFASILESGD